MLEKQAFRKSSIKNGKRKLLNNKLMNIEAEVRDIKHHVIAILKRIDELVYERDSFSMMKLTEKFLLRFDGTRRLQSRGSDLRNERR